MRFGTGCAKRPLWTKRLTNCWWSWMNRTRSIPDTAESAWRNNRKNAQNQGTLVCTQVQAHTFGFTFGTVCLQRQTILGSILSIWSRTTGKSITRPKPVFIVLANRQPSRGDTSVLRSRSGRHFCTGWTIFRWFDFAVYQLHSEIHGRCQLARQHI